MSLTKSGPEGHADRRFFLRIVLINILSTFVNNGTSIDYFLRDFSEARNRCSPSASTKHAPTLISIVRLMTIKLPTSTVCGFKKRTVSYEITWANPVA